MSGPPASSRNDEPSRITHHLLLFVAGREPNSLEAYENLLEICNAELRGRYELEVIDVFVDHERALEHGVLVAPCLVVLEPPPVVMIAGTLSNAARVRAALGLSEEMGNGSSD